MKEATEEMKPERNALKGKVPTYERMMMIMATMVMGMMDRKGTVPTRQQ